MVQPTRKLLLDTVTGSIYIGKNPLVLHFLGKFTQGILVGIIIKGKNKYKSVLLMSKKKNKVVPI